MKLHDKMQETFDIIKRARAEFSPKAVMALYSSGNDSTTVLHLVRSQIDAAVHCNTGVGIEEARKFARQTCADWDIKLIEEHPLPCDSYETFVMMNGFPGPPMHKDIYRRIKERSLRRVMKNTLGEVKKGSKNKFDRICFLTGIRKDESDKRAKYAEMQDQNGGLWNRVGRMVFVSPIYHWTKADLIEYRETFDLPENPVSALIHMSGECLCGAYAHPGEREELKFWFPAFEAYLTQLETKVAAKWQGKKPCVWGHGANKRADPRRKNPGPLCTDCSVIQ